MTANFENPEMRPLPKAMDGFGVNAECGFGWRLPETIPDLLRLHDAVCEPFLRAPRLHARLDPAGL